MEAKRYSDLSIRSAGALPNRRLETSADAGWTSLLLERHASRGDSGVFEVKPTDDQSVVLALKESHRLDVFDGRWRSLDLSPGAFGTSAAGESCRLRWASLSRDAVFETAHLYIPASIFMAAGEEYRRVGQSVNAQALSNMSMGDVVVLNTVVVLFTAMREGAPDLYAQTAREWLAVHLLRVADFIDRERHGGSPEIGDDRRIVKAIDAMRHHLADNLTLDWLASVAGISKYHFLRLFRRVTGSTPTSYLTEIRMQAAHRLLTSTDMPIAEIGRQCGYARANNFTAAFNRRFGASPATMRKRRDGPRNG